MDGYVLGAAVHQGLGRSLDLSLPHCAAFWGFPSLESFRMEVSVSCSQNTLWAQPIRPPAGGTFQVPYQGNSVFPYSLNNKFFPPIVLRPHFPPRRCLIVSRFRLTMGGTDEYLYERGRLMVNPIHPFAPFSSSLSTSSFTL